MTVVVSAVTVSVSDAVMVAVSVSLKLTCTASVSPCRVSKAAAVPFTHSSVLRGSAPVIAESKES